MFPSLRRIIIGFLSPLKESPSFNRFKACVSPREISVSQLPFTESCSPDRRSLNEALLSSVDRSVSPWLSIIILVNCTNPALDVLEYVISVNSRPAVSLNFNASDFFMEPLPSMAKITSKLMLSAVVCCATSSPSAQTALTDIQISITAACKTVRIFFMCLILFSPFL